MTQAERETLYDHKDRLGWIGKLGWNDRRLRQVPVHRQQTDLQPFISLTGAGPGDHIHLYVYKNDVPEDLWSGLSDFIAHLGSRSGFEQQGLEGTKVWESKKGRQNSA